MSESFQTNERGSIENTHSLVYGIKNACFQRTKLTASSEVKN